MFFNAASFGIGFASGFGTGLMTREISRAGASVVRPLVKSTVKTGVLAADQVRTAFAFARESLDDIVAEARDEARTEELSGEDEEGVSAGEGDGHPKRAKKAARRASRAAGAEAESHEHGEAALPH